MKTSVLGCFKRLAGKGIGDREMAESFQESKVKLIRTANDDGCERVSERASERARLQGLPRMLQGWQWARPLSLGSALKGTGRKEGRREEKPTQDQAVSLETASRPAS